MRFSPGTSRTHLPYRKIRWSTRLPVKNLRLVGCAVKERSCDYFPQDLGWYVTYTLSYMGAKDQWLVYSRHITYIVIYIYMYMRVCQILQFI